MKKLKYIKTFESYNAKDDDDDSESVNDILDNISKNGIESLTPLQKRTLDAFGGNDKEYQYNKKKGIIKFRGMLFEVEDDQLIMVEPYDYEGSYLEDYDGDVIECILSSIADYFDVRNRSEELSDEELKFISGNFTKVEQRKILCGWTIQNVNQNIGTNNVDDFIDEIDNIDFNDSEEDEY